MAKADFYRQEKQEIYAKLLTDVDRAIPAISAAAYSLGSTPEVEDPNTRKKRDTTYDFVGQVKDDYHVIRLIGSPDVVAAANECWGAVSAPILATDALAGKAVNNRLVDDDRAAAYGILDQHRARIDKSQDAFVTAARADLEATN